MVNSKAFALRLKKIMEFNEISATVMAEQIGVQRSSISHILSGRNKPSLEFVMKVIKAFPEVELYWLLNGTGSYPVTTSTPPAESTDNNDVDSPSSIVKNKDEKLLHESGASQKIEKIVVFYKDGTFHSYLPGDEH
jgi:DNA-binding XRE family transcriptional regulator